MKKCILLILALLTFGAQNVQARETTVNLVNWSSNYNIAVLNASGKWVQIPPKTIIKNVAITTTDSSQLGAASKLLVSACDKTSTKCGSLSKGDFTWNGQNFTTLSLTIIPGYNYIPTLVLDAGNSFFSGIDTSKDNIKKFSATKTVQQITLWPNSPALAKIIQSVKTGTINQP